MTRDEIMQSLKALVPEAERDAIDTENSLPVYQAAVSGLAAVSARRLRRSQASFLLPHSLQTGEPADFASPAKLYVTIERPESLDLAMLIPPRKMLITGPSGRIYYNVDAIEYARRDADAVREVLCECLVSGEVGNLDFLVNDDIYVPAGKPAGYFRSEHLTLTDQSRGRVNTGASIVQLEGSTTIKDSGIPSTFETSDRDLYVEILFSTDDTNIGKLYRIREHRWPGIEEPPNSNIRPTYAVLDDEFVPELLREALLDDGGAFTSYVAEANNQTADDFPLLPAAPAVDDAVYFGAIFPISALSIRIDTAADGVFTIVWETWNGVSWLTPETVQDGTVGLTAPGVVRVNLGNSKEQVATTVNGVHAFWVRARVSAFTSISTVPLAGYAAPLCYEPLDNEAGTVEWAVRDWKDLGVVINTARHGALGRDDDLGLLGDNRGMYRGNGETAEAFRLRISKVPDVVSPAALTRVVNRILAPLRLTGRVVDVGDQVNGFFFDTDAFDYYEEGDTYPLNQWKLLLSLWEAYGFFYVQLPLVSDGDFGMFYDEGPTLYLSDKGLYLGPAYDEGFYDGFSQVAAFQVYDLIYKEIERRKGGGIGFALLPDPSLNTLP
jgi:hypothetical protein